METVGFDIRASDFFRSLKMEATIKILMNCIGATKKLTMREKDPKNVRARIEAIAVKIIDPAGTPVLEIPASIPNNGDLCRYISAAA